MMKQKIDWRIVVAGMVCITALEMLALVKGINGVALTAVVGALAGLAGWSLPQLKVK